MKLVLFFLAALGTLAPATSQAQEWPSRSIWLVVPYSAGTAPDVIARLVGNQLSKRFDQPVLIDNRAGAGGLIGTEYAAAANNDGYTLFLGSLDTQAIIGHLYKNKRQDPATLQPISLLGRIVNVIAISPMLKINTFGELLSASKAGRSFTFATPGVGTNLHLIGELIKAATGANLVHVPYRSASTGYTDAMEGRVDLVIAGLPPVATLLEENKLKALVTTAPERVAPIPNTPTMAELGYKELTVVGWFGLLAPGGTSPAIVKKINAAVKEVAETEEYRSRMQAMFIQPTSSSVDEFASLINAESDRFGNVIKNANLSVQ